MVVPMFLYEVGGSNKISVLVRVVILAHDWDKRSGAQTPMVDRFQADILWPGALAN